MSTLAYRQFLVLVAGFLFILPSALLAQGPYQSGPPDPASKPTASGEEKISVQPKPNTEVEETKPVVVEPESPLMGGRSLMLDGKVGQMPVRADYRVTWFPDRPVSGQNTNLGLVRQDVMLGFPLWQDGPNEWSFTTSVRSELYNTGAYLPGTGQAFPEQLWNIRFGTTFRHLFDNGWILGGGISVGSASDKPFATWDEMTAGINAFLRIPSGERNAWLFSLAYSSNSEIPIPIPGVAYIWNPSDQFSAHIGLPFSLHYRPDENWSFDLSYMLLTTVHARATYKLCPPARLYAGFDWSGESYLLAHRQNTNDRFFYYDKRVSLGLEYRLGTSALLDIAGGYSFDRFYFQGHSYSDHNQNALNIDAGPFAMLRFNLRY